MRETHRGRSVAAAVGAASFSVVCIAGCPDPVTPKPTPTPATQPPLTTPPPVTIVEAGAPQNADHLLKPQNLSAQVTDFVQGRFVPRDLTTLDRDPGLALGTLYVITAKPTKTCDSTNPDDFVQDRYPDFRKFTAECKVKPFQADTLYSEIVKGEVKGKLELVVGKGQVDASSYYELKYENAATAVFESVSACLDKQALQAQELPPRTCYAKVVVGAALTSVTWRSYKKIDAQIAGSYLGLVKVGVDVLGSTDSLKVTNVISVDAANPGLYATGADGFLHLSKKQDAKDDFAKFLTTTTTGKPPGKPDDKVFLLFLDAAPGDKKALPKNPLRN